ncbi:MULTISPECIES: ABC transporter ATP-binding protein [Zobellia]|uniref:ABC transporter, ATPase component n=1 Tax=Zobellia galactanivorans (strain DSM 12802 / CCUG 47099 / CIP 106680 / NCIMB 13871 / Dsij) TaxID=63186 RepID=G0L907_ZOBGA|nr:MULTISPECIES: ABC transporter ATP-binding protein [Zobellia]OWW24682.1 ABC transporter ATP-binding protein [Zobellia sp. OII3]CAZ94295.1 ABC transporter, ATPase component [Zobellia galactanivorans]
MAEKSIEIIGLTKKYGEHVAVDNLTLSVEKGEIFGLLGPNGAGKSTTILMLLGLTEVDSGSVKVCGIDTTRFPLEVKRKVGYLPEDVGFYNDYSGLQNLLYIARLNNIPMEEAQKTALETLADVGLEEVKDNKVASYSRGMRQRLGLADVLIKKPEVIILDEPTLGLDPEGVKKFLQLIVDLSRKKGITVLFSSHHLHQVQQLCDRVGIFVKGKLLAEGKISSLAEQLFSKNTFTIEGEISSPPEKQTPEALQEVIDKIKGIKEVAKVELKNEHFVVESKKDISPEVSRLLVNSGYGLAYLSKKKYGLDDIYHQYFQEEK